LAKVIEINHSPVPASNLPFECQEFGVLVSIRFA
jgi:hypothetical protein